MTKRMVPLNYSSCMVVSGFGPYHKTMLIHATTGHTARPTDFCWAPGEGENWTAASTSEDNVVMVWQPTMRVWAGDEVKIDQRELEGDAMDVEMIAEEAGPSDQTEDEKMDDAAEQEKAKEGEKETSATEDKAKSVASGGSGTQSMSVSAAASVSGADD